MRRLALSIGLLLTFGVAPSPAAVFVAGSVSDAGDWAPGDGSCDTSPIVGVTICTLRAAVQEANALPGHDVIQLYDGVYPLSIAGEDDTAAAGDLDVTSSIQIEGFGPGETIIEQNAADRVFAIPFPGTGNLVLSRLTLRGGDAGDAFGGGAFVYSGGYLGLDRVEITDCAARVGGGVFNYGVTQMVDTWIHGNHADWRAGGVASASLSSGGGPATTLSIDDSTIGPNASDAGPTELELANAGSAVLTNTTVSPADTEGFSVEIANEDVVFSHVTIRGEISTYSFSGADTLQFSNSAIEYCNALASPQPVTSRLGVNASANAGCGFAAAGGIEAPFLLGALADRGGATPTLLPGPASAFIDAADLDRCEGMDQRGVSRPQDGDRSGAAQCDVGAVEVPEPGPLGAVLAAFAILGHLRRRGR